VSSKAAFPLGNHTPPAPKLDGWKTCRQGDEGDNVKLAQQALADNGYKNSTGRKPIVVDGMFGPNTDRRTRQFQTDANIVVDGIFGPQTAGALQVP
jgi:peptidoglycan hydrolase-like protein with peptidoglycan-binding domain